MNLFSGRISRSVFFLSLVSLNVLIPLILEITNLSMSTRSLGLLSGLIYLAVFSFVGYLIIVQIGIYAKRWHDVGKSGWLTLLNIVPILGQILTIVLFFIPGEAKKNKYGNKPMAIRF